MIPASAAHPLGIKPLGNAWDATTANIRVSSGLFAILPDEVIVSIFDYLQAPQLLHVGATCRALFAFSHLEDLWKSLYLSHFFSRTLAWRGTWRSTCLNLSPSHTPVISCSGLYSDVLHRPWQCARLPLSSYASDIPRRNAITRFPTLSQADFGNWVKVPFILTAEVQTWPIYQSWSMPELLSKYKDTMFRAEAVEWTLATYYDYMRCNQDESPLYLFDFEFAEKMKLNLDADGVGQPAYTPIRTFEPDLFDVLGEHRPNRRWLIVGPRGSGSTFHADPNGTSAWNAVIRGRKYWLMFPPPIDGKPPVIPGIHVSEDLSEVTAPLSLSEYLLTFHTFARKSPGCIEAVCEEGEVLYVPAGWYHMVVNLDEGIAVTQNFVSEANAVNVLRFLRDRADQVSGFKRSRDSDHEGGSGMEFELFKSRLGEKYSTVLDRAMAGLKEDYAKKNKKRKWEEATAAVPYEDQMIDGEGFSFGFAVEDEDSEA